MASPDATSLSATFGVEPYEFYEQVRGRNPVDWDEGLGAWVIYDYTTNRTLLRKDIESMRMPEMDNLDMFVPITGAPRGIVYLTGEAQRRIHRWFVLSFNAPFVEGLRGEVVGPLVERVLKPLISAGRAELVEEFAEQIPVRVAAAAMDLPWQDDEWIMRAKNALRTIGVFFGRRLMLEDEIIERAREASTTLNAMLMPYVEERRSGTGDDLISKLWREGPSLLDDWGPSDVLGQVRTTFLAGTDTTTHTICNMLYMLLRQDDEVRQQLRDGGAPVQANFVEEALRLYGTVHFRVRHANEDIQVGDAVIKKDEPVVPMLAAANRDPERYACPHAIDLQRDRPRDHVAFNFGPRACAGQALARTELQEVVRAMVDLAPNMRLDPDAPPPALVGFTNRSFQPLNVVFDPAAR